MQGTFTCLEKIKEYLWAKKIKGIRLLAIAPVPHSKSTITRNMLLICKLATESFLRAVSSIYIEIYFRFFRNKRNDKVRFYMYYVDAALNSRR